MNINEVKEACMNRVRIIVRKNGGATFRGHHIIGIIHKPDYKTGKWRPFVLVAYGENEPYTIYGSGSGVDNEIPIENIYVDKNQYSDGYTSFLNFKDKLSKEVEAEQMTINGGY